MDTGSTGISPYGFSKDNPEGFAVWKVEELLIPEREDFARDRRTFERDYLQLKQLTLIEEWLADSRRAAAFELMTDDEPPDAGG